MSPLKDIVHYNRGVAFQSVTASPTEKWAGIVSRLNGDNCWGLNRFLDPDYLPRRHRVERDLRAKWVARGGRALVDHPFYCTVGRRVDAGWERQRRPGMRGHVIDLDLVPSDLVSFTLGDSLLSWDPVYRQHLAQRGQKPALGTLYRREDLVEVGLPTAHLEAQLWVAPPAEWVRIVEIEPHANRYISDPGVIEAVVFDLGGVLVQHDYLGFFKAIGRTIPIDVWKRWMLEDPVARDFEAGQSPPSAFCEAAIAHFELPIGVEPFQAAFVSWMGGPHPAAGDLVKAVGAKLPTYCLSNSNFLHWSRLEEIGLTSWFERCFASHQLSTAKPDPDVFQVVEDALGVAPEQILFIDDNIPNVEAAAKRGWCAQHVVGFDDTLDLLKHAGVVGLR